ncbi:MAG: CPXCG motif-containing cysteine-rich protein [Candidatus Igneacidithiobacillus chanchocoensis]
MAAPLEYLDVQCPYCGETFAVEVDISAGTQQTIEDCRVCCAPAELYIRIGDEGNIVDVQISGANT